MWDFLERLFGGGFMPHGHCYLWTPEMVWLQVLSNGAIGVAYLAISATLYYIVHRIKDVPFSWMFVAFGVFIITCGGTHFLDVVTVWHPIYWADGTLRAITAIASVGTAVMLVPLVPKAIALAGAARVAHERGVELATTYAELATAHQQARELETLKARFFTNASHELRTPLALILGPAEQLQRSAHLGPADRRNLDTLTRNAIVLLERVNDVLDVSKLDAGRLEARYARADLAESLRRTCALFDGAARERAFSLTVNAPPVLFAEYDPALIERVMVNLLSNAAAFVPAGGSIRCILSVEGETATLRVQDDGPGVPDSEKQRIFERFGQAEGDVERPGGSTGLGLAIAREFVELHRGSIEVVDATPTGALFLVELPCRAPMGAALSPTKHFSPPTVAVAMSSAGPGDLAEPAEPFAPLVLIVEDNAEMRDFTRRCLEPDYRVETAADGEQGLEKARALRPDAIITDMAMPKMDGEALVTALRADLELTGIPIMVLSARTDPATTTELLRNGAQDYVSKPFGVEELKARLANLVGTKRVRDILQQELNTHRVSVESLVIEVASRKRELERALAATQEAREAAVRESRSKTDFLNLLSHEIRTPLTSLQLNVELMSRPRYGPLTELQHTLSTRMRVALGRLTATMASLLEYASLHKACSNLQLASLVPEAFFRELVETLQPTAPSGVDLSVVVASGVPTLRSDAALLTILVNHLVGNALKFTKKGHVAVLVDFDGADHVIAVVDSGPGIPKSLQAAVFEAFHVAEAIRHKHVPGVGLGLTVAQYIAAALGGTLHLQSEEGKGSTFSLRIARIAGGSS